MRLGLTKKAARDSDGAISCSNCSRFESSSADIWVNPVVLPPGRASDATRPSSTGLLTCMNTIGIVRVAACKAIVSCRPTQAMTAGASATSSRAKLPNRSGWPIA